MTGDLATKEAGKWPSKTIEKRINAEEAVTGQCQYPTRPFWVSTRL